MKHFQYATTSVVVALCAMMLLHKSKFICTDYGMPFVPKFNQVKYLFNPIILAWCNLILINLPNIFKQSEKAFNSNPCFPVQFNQSQYLFNPITEIFIQSNHEDIYSIQSRKYLFNPITEIFIQSVKYSFNPITEIFIQSNHKNIYSISHSYSIHSKTYSMQSSRNSFNLPGASVVSIKHGLRTDGLRTGYKTRTQV